MLVKLIVVLAACAKLVTSERYTEPGPSELWPTLYFNTDTVVTNISHIELTLFNTYRPIYDSVYAPAATKVYKFDSSSNEFQEALYRSRLSKTSNCRPSYDKWNCEHCLDLIPDAVVVRSFSTFPGGITGFIAVSESEKRIHVMIRGASSFRNKIQFGVSEVVPHPDIPGAIVNEGLLNASQDISEVVRNTLNDQLILHPDYRVDVTGHSFGGSVASLVLVDIYNNIPQLNSTNVRGYFLGKSRVGNFEYAQFFHDENLKVIRYVQGSDDFAHQPPILDGFVHEGDEHWISEDLSEITICPGPYDTKNCSNSVPQTDLLSHITYVGIQQNCNTDYYNIL